MSGVVVGVGLDVADTGRFERLIRRGAGRVWAHWYTEAEAEECLRHPRPAEAATLRFAVKEATYKAVGAHFAGPVRWRDIEVLGQDAVWRLELGGEVEEAATAARVDSFHVTTCHLERRVMAMVIAEHVGIQTIRGGRS